MDRRTIAPLVALTLLAAPGAHAREETKLAAAPLYVVSGVAMLLGCVESEADGADEGLPYARDGSSLSLGGSYALMDFRQDIFIENERQRFPGQSGAMDAFRTVPVRKAHPIQADDSPGLNVRAGYRCHPHVGVEAEFDWLSGFDASFNSSFPPPDLGPGGVRGTIDAWHLAGNVKLFLLTGRVQPFIVSGIGAMRARGGNLFAQRPDLGVNRVPPQHRDGNPSNGQDDPLTGAALAASLRKAKSGPLNLKEEATEFTVRLGAGLDVYLTENVVFSVEGVYADPGGLISQLNHAIVSFGLKYRF